MKRNDRRHCALFRRRMNDVSRWLRKLFKIVDKNIIYNIFMQIHTIGDSHSGNGWDQKIQHWLGPILCYSFGKEKLDRCDIRNFDIKDGDTIVFCFGEIDCRCHVHKHITESTTYRDIIDDIVANYFEAIKLNITMLSEIKLNKVCVYNVVPTVKKENKYESLEFPYLGTDEERKTYVLYFNKKLKEKCAEYGYVFFDVYDKYIDVDGFLNEELSDGNVHIRDGVHIREFISEYLLQG
jgi:hypothetical protein